MKLLRGCFCVVSVGLMVVMLSSCKQETSVEKPVGFEPSVDGVAVGPYTQMDLETARQINSAGKYDPFAGASTEAALAPVTPEPAEPTGTGGEFDEGPADTFDPNDAFGEF